LRLLMRGLHQVPTRGTIERLLVLQERARRPSDDAERRAQIVGDRAQERASEALGLDLDLGVSRLFGKPHAFEGGGDLAREGIEELALLRINQCSRMSGPNPQDADLAASSAKEEEPCARRWERVRAEARGLALGPNPFDDTRVVSLECEHRIGGG